LPGVLRPQRVFSFASIVVLGAACLAGRANAAPSDDESAVAELSRDTAHAALVRGPLLRAQDALKRAKSMDRAGDSAHARLARALAHEWTRVGLDLIRAATLEEKARLTEKSLDELDTKTVRGRALLEETAARRGRAKEALDELEHAPPPPPPTAPAKGHAKPAGKPKASAPEHD
jgi:hypothetical protein